MSRPYRVDHSLMENHAMLSPSCTRRSVTWLQKDSLSHVLLHFTIFQQPFFRQDFNPIFVAFDTNSDFPKSFSLNIHALSRFLSCLEVLDRCERQIVDTSWNDLFLHFIYFSRTDISLAVILQGSKNITLVSTARKTFLELNFCGSLSACWLQKAAILSTG